MENTGKSVLSWSGGKDACLALYLTNKKRDVKKLITSISAEFQRISMHGVPLKLLKKQVSHLGLDLQSYELPEGVSMHGYDQIIESLYTSLKLEGVETVIFGDIFLADLRAYREDQLTKHGLKAKFPIWERNTKQLAMEFIQLGFKAIVVAVSDKKLGESYCGVEYDLDFLENLPKDVDPCGENGEFHTFVYDGPIFESPVPVKRLGVKAHSYTASDSGEWESKFWFCDLA